LKALFWLAIADSITAMNNVDIAIGVNAIAAIAIATTASGWIRSAQADHGAASGSPGAQPTEGLEQGEVLAQLPGLKTPGGG